MNAINGKIIFNSLRDKNCIILACNPRITVGVASGIFRAAKELDSAIILELAETECNLDGGYSNYTPHDFAHKLIEANSKINHDIWALHADHIKVISGSPEELSKTKELILAQIKAGYTSFCIDASHLFDFNATNLEGELTPNIKATIEIGNFIDQYAKPGYGLEVEVGEIGRKNSDGLILTKPDEAVFFINRLVEAGLKPDLIAIANGSTHGNVYDDNGNEIQQTSINIELTKKVAQALRDNNFNVRIAQHGITGTPIEIITNDFPHDDILKGNVATLFQDIVFNAIKKFDPKLYEEIFNWTIKNKTIDGNSPEEIFGKNAKFAIKPFFDRIYSINNECQNEIEQNTYNAVCKYIKAFKSEGSAEIVRKNIK